MILYGNGWVSGEGGGGSPPTDDRYGLSLRSVCVDFPFVPVLAKVGLPDRTVVWLVLFLFL